MKTLDHKIVAFGVKKTSDTAAPVPVSQDLDPANVRIESRPEGSLNAVSEKITYSTSEGRRKVYILVSFMNVDGVIDGEPVNIERPIEFFYPIGQETSEYQWISASMRSLSLAARGGYAAQALSDMRKVAWDKGPVRCGTNEFGKPLYHDSEVAAIAWSLQQILIRRGFLDEQGTAIPTRERLKSASNLDITTPFTVVESASESTPTEDMTGVVGSCPDCGDHLRLRDGCPSCSTCGYSKC